MKTRSEYSTKLYQELKRRGYREELCTAISYEMNTDYVAKRMLGYLAQFPKLPQEEIIDEMLAILSDRETYVQKKLSEEAQASINEFLMYGLGTENETD